MSKFTMEKATHVLCGRNFEESHVQEARELYEIPVVNEQWVINSVKLNKLVPTKPYFPTTTGKLFHGFIFTMTQIESQDRLKLYAMITLHGGNVQKDLDNKVTHLLMGGSQSVALKVAGLTKMTIVTPDWVVECLKNRKLIEPDMFHPNLLVSPVKQPSKVTLMSGDMKTPAAIRSQLQQNVRPSRPMVVQMQHTPQQINEIIQSQIQQQQMQEQAKQRAAAAAQAAASQSNNPQGAPSLLISQAESGNTTSTATTSILVQKQVQQPQIPQNLISGAVNNTILLQKQPQQVQQQPTQIPQQSPQIPQSPTQQTMMRMQMQNQAQSQGIIQNQPQTTMSMQPQQMMPQNQQANMVMQQQAGQSQEKQQFIMKQVQAQPQQSQQFNMGQNQPQQQFIMKQVQSQQSQNQQQQQPQTPSGPGYIQIIQQGKQIIQIQHPDGGQMHQKNFMQNQPQIQQQVQLNQAMQQQNPPNVAIQQTSNAQHQMPLQQNQSQQVPSSPMQQQPPRQNIVIINQLQNPQNANQMGMQQQRYIY